MGFYSAGVCFDSADLAAQDYMSRAQVFSGDASGGFSSHSVVQILNSQTLWDGKALVTFDVQSNYFNAQSSSNTGAGSSLMVTFAPCDPLVIHPRTLTEVFLFYKPTQSDFDALSILLIGFPITLFFIAKGLKATFDLIRQS